MIDLKDLREPIDISIPLRFNGPQPNAYGVETATSMACEAGDMVGDTRRGGSVNFERVSFIPHCNGTHTECVGHITDERISVLDCLVDVMMPAVFVSVEPERVDGGDLGNFGVAPVIGQLPQTAADRDVRVPTALVVRTMPNDDSKLTRQYGDTIPPYFSAEAMEFIVEAGFKHLLVDLPSIDRIYDDGKLTNHRIFWKVGPGSFETNMASRIHSTITEMIYVPSSVEDGEYLLNLQIAPFEADAAPSRPVLFLSEPPA